MSAQPFADSALELARHGLVVIPLGGDDGKKPLVGGFDKWRGQRPETVEQFAGKFPSANIGIVHGRCSRTMAVDVDSPAQIAAALVRFGDTPIMVETPRAGAHLFYRFAGERCADLRSDGMEIDIKSTGGITTAPPSVRPTGRYKGRPYRLIRGAWADLKRLPRIKPGSLPQLSGKLPEGQQEISRPSPNLGIARNNSLYKASLRHARQCQSLDSLLEHARMENSEFTPPLPDGEVAQTAASAWRAQCEGRNWAGQEPQFVAPFAMLAKLREHPDALAVYTLLRECHAGLTETFAFSPKGMANANVMRDWRRRRYEVARDWLLENGFIEMTHKGGRSRGDASQFKFPRACF